MDLQLEFSSRTVLDFPIAEDQLCYYLHSDWVGFPDGCSSTSCYVHKLNGAAFSWRFKRQSVHAIWSAEAEFIPSRFIVQKVIFLRRLPAQFRFPRQTSTPIIADNETCIRWSQGAVGGSERAKHIDLHRHSVHAASDRAFFDNLLFRRHCQTDASAVAKLTPAVVV